MIGFWLRWSRRDLRPRWVQVVATALVLAVGVGGVCRSAVGLSSGAVARWMRVSPLLGRPHEGDLPINPTVRRRRPPARAGGSACRHACRRSGTIGGPVADRRVAPPEGRSVLSPAAPGRSAVPAGRAASRWDPRRKPPAASMAGAGLSAVLDWNFAHHYGPPRPRTRAIAGLGVVGYRGLASLSQHLLIVDQTGISGAGPTRGRLPSACGRPARRQSTRRGQRAARATAAGRISSASRDSSAARCAGAAGRAVHDHGEREQPASVLRDGPQRSEDLHRLRDLGARRRGLRGFNLVSRVVEAQRREIGIGMALGAEPRALILRPLALGLQIAVLGAGASVCRSGSVLRPRSRGCCARTSRFRCMRRPSRRGRT